MKDNKLEVLSAYRSDIAQTMFHVDGALFSLDDYPCFLGPYDGNYKKLLLKCARQVGKSTTLSTFMVAAAIGQPFFKSFFISPSQEQTRKFSHTRVAKILAYSPALRKGFVGPQSIDNVSLRMLTNGSEMAFSYAWDDADRCRGVSADMVCLDECQDMLSDVFPVILESMSNCKYGPYELYAGTPKSMGTMEYLWDLSSETEWCMKCDGCSAHTFITNTKALGKKGPICLKCGKDLNPRNGRWIDMKSGASIKGFHISQPMLPRNVPAAWPTSHPNHEKAVVHWQELLAKLETHGENTFLNECLAMSTSIGARLLTRETLEDLCDERNDLTRIPMPRSFDGIVRTFAGVDWSGGGAEVKGSEGLFKSRTVLSIFGQTEDGRLKLLFYKIFPNAHAVGWIDEIVEVCNAWRVTMVCGDAGEGALANSMLKKALGDHRVMQAQYMSSSSPVKWSDPKGAYFCDRTSVIDNFARMILHKQVIFGRSAQMQPAFSDILSIYEHVTTSGRKVWLHPPTVPDDAFHSQLFAWLAWRVISRDLQFY